MARLIFLGPPGAGKGTQAERLKADLGLTHLATGDLLREALAAETQMGLEAKKYMDAGDLVPDEVVVGIIRDRMTGDTVNNFLLDGFPRTLPQAEALDEMLTGLDAPVDHVLSLEVPRDDLVSRLAGRWLCRKCGRSFHEKFAPYQDEPCSKDGDRCDLYQRDDDKAEAVENRLNVFAAQTEPLVEYYDKAGLLRRIDGGKAQDEVYEQIRSAVQGR
ncbi:MAG: adenylate kinase [Thermoleophilia bacterium]|nr:adenylate kinase [Thermoleophilia bacterium]